MVTAREAAYRSLNRIEAEGRYSNLELDSAIRREGLEGAEKRLFTMLVYGVLERMKTLDFLIEALYTGRDALDGRVRTVLRLGLYQLCWAERIPASAAVNESVKLTQRFGIGRASGLVNGLLRHAARILAKESADGWIDRLIAEGGLTGSRRLAVRFSVCEGLAAMLADSYGEAKAEAILSAPRQPWVSLRVNSLRLPREELAARLGEGASLSPLAPDCVRFAGDGEAMLDAIGEGLCFAEDEASQLTAAALGAGPGDKVLDCCAAPGGKSFSIALDMKNDGLLLSCDLHGNKLRLVESGAARLGLTVIETREADAAKADFLGDGERPFDRILCDVPCSGSGVILKKPELRYRDPSENGHLPAVQAAILANASRFLRPGGRLVYSTCTLSPAENEAVVRQFLAAHPDFTLASPPRTFFPDTDATDGFFCAVLGRKQDGDQAEKSTQGRSPSGALPE